MSSDKGTLNIRYDAGDTEEVTRVSISLDGKNITEYSGSLTNWAQAPDAHPDFPGQPLTSIFVLRDSFDINAWTLRVFDGEAKILRPAAPSGTTTP